MPFATASRSVRSAVSKVEAPRLQHLRHQPVGPAVDVVGEQHVVAGGEREEQGRLGAQTRAEREPPLALFERGEGGLEGRTRGVPPARVVPDLRLADGVLDVRGGLEDRHVDRAVHRVGVLTRVDRARIEPQIVSGGRSPPAPPQSSNASPAHRGPGVHSSDLRFASWPRANVLPAGPAGRRGRRRTTRTATRSPPRSASRPGR